MPQTFSFEEALQDAPQREEFSFEEAVASPTPPIGELRLRPPPMGIRSTISGGPPIAPAPLAVTAPELAEEAGQTLGRATEPLVPFTKIVPEGPMKPIEALGAAVLAPKLSAMFGPETPVAAGREVGRAVLGIPEFMTSPVGMATGGLAATGKLAQTLVSLGFAADMAVSLVRQGAEVIPNWKNMTYPERARAIVQAVSTGALGGLLTAHGVKGVREMVAPKPPVIPTFTPEQQAADVEARRAMVPRPGPPSRTPVVEDYFEPTQPEPAKPVSEPEKAAADIIEQARPVLPKAAEEAAKVVPVGPEKKQKSVAEILGIGDFESGLTEIPSTESNADLLFERLIKDARRDQKHNILMAELEATLGFNSGRLTSEEARAKLDAAKQIPATIPPKPFDFYYQDYGELSEAKKWDALRQLREQDPTMAKYVDSYLGQFKLQPKLEKTVTVEQPAKPTVEKPAEQPAEPSAQPERPADAKVEVKETGGTPPVERITPQPEAKVEVEAGTPLRGGEGEARPTEPEVLLKPEPKANEPWDVFDASIQPSSAPEGFSSTRILIPIEKLRPSQKFSEGKSTVSKSVRSVKDEIDSGIKLPPVTARLEIIAGTPLFSIRDGHHRIRALIESGYTGKVPVDLWIEKGKPVPPEVLAEYPDLNPKEPPVPQPKEPAAKTGEGETPISRIDRELQGQWVTPAIKGELTRRRAAIVEGQSKGQRYVPYRHSDIGSNRWSVVDTTTGNRVEFPVTIQHPERGEIRTTRLAFQTKKQALDAIQAQSPPVKMQSEVQKVAKTEGTRSAKEIKTDLVSQLQDAYDKAPSESGMPLVVQDQLKIAKAGPKISRNYPYGKKGDEQQAKDRLAEQKRIDQQAVDAGFSKITINIPDDGEFTLWNTKESIADVLEAAKRLKTSPQERITMPKGRMDAAAALKKDFDDAMRVYGTEANAFQKLSSQLSRASDLGIEPEQQKRIEKLLGDLKRRIEVPWRRAQGNRKIIEDKINDRTRQKLPPLTDDSPEMIALRAAENAEAKEKGKVDAQLKVEPPAKPPSTGIVGMGGAVPEEFGKPGDFVSNMFAAIDRDRVARGEKPMEPVQGRTWDEANQKALAMMNRDPQWIPNLIAEVSTNPRPLLDFEQAGVVWQRAHWKAEASNAMKRLGEAFDDNRLQDMEDANKDIARYEQGLNFLDSVVGRGGTGSEAGRSLRAQAMGAGEDFTLYDMVNRTRAARGGGPVTAEEMSKFAKQEAEWKAKNEELQKTIAEKEKRIAEVEAQKALSEIEARSVKRVSTYDKRILDYAESIVKKMESAADSARDRILARRREGRQYVGIPVEELADYAIIGSAKIARGIKDFAAWSDAMKNELGDWISADLKQIWDASHASLTETLKDKSEPVKQTIRRARLPKDPEQVIEDNLSRIQNKVDKGQKQHITPQVKALAEVFWNRGIRKLDPMIEALHAVLKQSMPDIDRLQTLDALSGRGVFTRPSQIEVKKGIRDLSQQARLVGHQIDVEAGRPLPRTGPQRDPMSPEARREQAKLNELKRRFGVVITDPKAQLESALGQAKTYIRNRLADMAEEIRRREKFVKSKTALVPDAELAALKQEYSDMKKDWDQVFPRQPLTPEQRIAAANRGLDRAISALESDLEAGRLFPEKRGATPVETPELTEKRAWLAALREQRQELRDIANPKKTPLERALQTRKTRIANRIAELEQRLAEGNFEPKPRREPPIDADVLRLLVEKEKIEKAFNRGVELDKLKRRTKLQKAVAIAKESLNLPRNVMSSWDVSAVLRQGGFFAFSHPFRAAKSIAPMFRALVSEDRTLATELEILNRPNAPLYKKAKLYLAPHDSLKLSAQEEAIMSSISDKIPGVKHSNRAYITFLNKLRADSFDAMKSAIERPERPLTQPELMAIADYVNTATGRGMHRIDRMPGLAEGLAGIFFSPRLVASRFQMLGRPLEGFRQGGETSFRVRRAVAEDYARFAIGIGTVLSLGALAGGTIEFDPRSADFGKIRFGKTRVDPLAGLGQVTVLLSRVLSGQTKNQRGQIKSLTAEGAKYGGQTIPGVIGNFLRSKLSPVTGAALDLRYGKNVVGEKMTWKDIPERMLIPLSWGDVLNVMEEQGVPRGTAIEILSLMGMGVQHYDDMNRRQ